MVDAALCSGASSTVNEATLKELSTKRGTVTPFWWAIKTLFVVRTFPFPLCSARAAPASHAGAKFQLRETPQSCCRHDAEIAIW